MVEYPNKSVKSSKKTRKNRRKKQKEKRKPEQHWSQSLWHKFKLAT